MGLAPNRKQDITWGKDDQVLQWYTALLGHNKLDRERKIAIWEQKILPHKCITSRNTVANELETTLRFRKLIKKFTQKK